MFADLSTIDLATFNAVQVASEFTALFSKVLAARLNWSTFIQSEPEAVPRA